MSELTAPARTLCTRCLRPTSVCYCALLPTLPTVTRVVLLQHPREARMPIGTARMAHLALPNSELHHGVCFDGHPRVKALAAQPGAALLFPGEGAQSLSELGPTLTTLVVIDGTWSQARKVLHRSPLLQQLPRLAFTPARPSNYRIRREPKEHFVSTVEAVVEILGELEGDPERFAPLLAAFDRMVDRQIARASQRSGPRHRRLFTRPPRSMALPEELSRYEALVLVYAEANADRTGSPELVQLLALRPSTGERFAALVAPERSIAPATLEHLETTAVRLLSAERCGAVLARFQAFLGDDALLCGWGEYSREILERVGPGRPFHDLRVTMARRLLRRAGAVEDVAELLGAAQIAPLGEGRGGRHLAALARVLGALRQP